MIRLLSMSGLTTLSKNRWLDWSLGRSEEWGKIWETSEKLAKFKCLFPHYCMPLTSHKTYMLNNNLKKDAIKEFGIKYLTSNPVWVKFSEHGSSFYMNMLIVEKNIDLQILTGRLKHRLLAGIKIVQMPLMERCTRYTITLLLTKSCREQWCISLNTSHKLLDKKLYFCSRNLILIRFVLYIHLYPSSIYSFISEFNISDIGLL